MGTLLPLHCSVCLAQFTDRLVATQNTSCTPDYGDCGCDNCVGAFEDISTRMDEFAERLWDDGWDRTRAVWTVPQAFGDDT